MQVFQFFRLEAGLENPPYFPGVLLAAERFDEAQFFAPVWLELLRRALKRGGHFFLCADPTQGFLRRRLSWSDMGLEMRNRSRRLERPYRSTRAILFRFTSETKRRFHCRFFGQGSG